MRNTFDYMVHPETLLTYTSCVGDFMHASNVTLSRSAQRVTRPRCRSTTTAEQGGWPEHFWRQPDAVLKGNGAALSKPAPPWPGMQLICVWRCHSWSRLPASVLLFRLGGLGACVGGGCVRLAAKAT